MAESPNPKRITIGQKVGVTFMFLFAFLALGMGVLQLRTTVYGPFVSQTRSKVSAAEQAQLQFDESLKLQRIDTDKDGLNDFEELNFYQTSAYLPDTDSDGISDKKEINDGTDPLCPEGKDCGLGADGTSTETVDGATLENPIFDKAFQTSGNMLGAGQTGEAPSILDLNALLGDPTQLRAALLASGQLSAEELAQFNDAQLIDLAQNALKSQSVSTQQTQAPVAVSTQTDVTVEQLQALLEKPDELRQLLITTEKMTKEQLDQIDDATLISVTKDIIAKNR
ncbi:MAG: hypothetical protein AUJ37_02035 [Candidatus Magasanikbacteria bacterium CG1_02_41_34]|uniref:Uncharacterized protein n=2 Tax=Candidatus Magasanikiibacteriota TaxID=1752731 RepID=A0A2M7V579_9BACT|nr:MAG: hypothetical protein AUJ37_02035 [Candidatus Magasanikbacteria bacterium CG1_02_41_34]PIZ93752.1 MAG: hypothetical protein COX83_01295 [Candidatus Magasanikbacteria bacterium CG_4_10_14_0_2_um_filter_41_31]PJC52946.1 MAG: hypothetical protein CO030_00230 [Candidatus Magasanikbacteria bacterium CG_4_9_14_0_2_um_filter_42_11]